LSSGRGEEGHAVELQFALNLAGDWPEIFYGWYRAASTIAANYPIAVGRGGALGRSRQGDRPPNAHLISSQLLAGRREAGAGGGDAQSVAREDAKWIEIE
jgi:hypothetical protein